MLYGKHPDLAPPVWFSHRTPKGVQRWADGGPRTRAHTGGVRGQDMPACLPACADPELAISPWRKHLPMCHALTSKLPQTGRVFAGANLSSDRVVTCVPALPGEPLAPSSGSAYLLLLLLSPRSSVSRPAVAAGIETRFRVPMVGPRYRGQTKAATAPRAHTVARPWESHPLTSMDPPWG